MVICSRLTIHLKQCHHMKNIICIFYIQQKCGSSFLNSIILPQAVLTLASKAVLSLDIILWPILKWEVTFLRGIV